jgi:ATP-binding cassette subfamily C (CFTR/MRP) protein 1
MKNKDTRAKLIDEVLSTIKVIKLYAWEIPFKRRINEIRENELVMLKKIGYLSAAQRWIKKERER